MSSSFMPSSRRALRVVLCCVSALMLAASPAMAEKGEGGVGFQRSLDRIGGLAVRTADLLVVRPISFGYLAGGFVGWAVGTAVIYVVKKAPYAAIMDDPDQTGYEEEMLDNFVRIPGAFVFQRKLGDFSANGLGPG